MKPVFLIAMAGLILTGCASQPDRITAKPPVAIHNDEPILGDEAINSFLKAIIQLEEIELPEGDELAFELKAFDDEGTFSPFSANLGIFEGTEVEEEVARILEEADLGDGEQFTAIGDRIYRAYAAIQLEDEALAALKEAEESESEEAMMEAQTLLAAADLAPEEDKIAVRKYVEQMRQVLGR
ncbi:MAG: hypothetical protein ACC655_05035 [Rhodothermia bacterium]